MTNLTPKQEKFCQVFFNTGNATYAYKKVYDCKKIKADSLRNTAKNLKDHPKIQARLKELQEQYERESSVDRRRIEQVLVDIVTSMDSDLYDIDESGDKVKRCGPRLICPSAPRTPFSVFVMTTAGLRLCSTIR